MTGLQLVRLPLDLRAFTRWALSRGYLDPPPGDSRGRPRDAEIGYAAHAALTGLFGDQAPRPFVISLGGQRERRHIATTPERRVGFHRRTRLCACTCRDPSGPRSNSQRRTPSHDRPGRNTV